MNNKTFTYLLIAGVIAMSAILLLNLAGVTGLFQPQLTNEYLSRNDVRGIDIDHEGKLWTLNFEQQNKVINILNAAVRTTEHFAPENTGFDKLIIYRFNRPDIILTPLKVVNNQLAFAITEWNLKGNLKESNAGELLQVLSQTYDH
jgi:hypothetical protein